MELCRVKFRRWLPLNFKHPLPAKPCIRPQKVLEVQERAWGSLSPCKVWWGSDFTRCRAAKYVKFFCLSVCSSRFWMSEFVHTVFPWRCWNTETILIPLDRGRFVVVCACLTFADCRQLATPQNAKVQKMAKFREFSLPAGDRINWSRWNLVCKLRPWSTLAYQIWPSSVKGLCTGAPKCQNLPKIVFFVSGHNKQIQVKFGM